MFIKLKSLFINSYNPDDIENAKFIKEIKEANQKDNFLYNCIDEMIKKSATSDNLHIGYGYIVEDSGKLVGFVRPARKENKYTLDIDYGVHPNYRHQGYGTKILVEVSDFFLENICDVHNIKLSIDSSNQYSIKCAEKAGFIELNDDFPKQFKTYMKRIGRHEDKIKNT